MEPDDDDGDDHDRERDENRGIDERGDGLPLYARHDLDVGDVAPQHLLEIARLLTRHQRRRVDTGKQGPVRFERLRQRATRSHALVDVVQHALEDDVRNALTQDVERLHQRHAGFEERRQFLVEDEELAAGDFVPVWQRGQVHPRERAPTGLVNREDVKPFVLEFPAEPRLAVGDVHALDDLATRSAEATPEFHQYGEILRLILHN